MQLLIQEGVQKVLNFQQKKVKLQLLSCTEALPSQHTKSHRV